MEWPGPKPLFLWTPLFRWTKPACGWQVQIPPAKQRAPTLVMLRRAGGAPAVRAQPALLAAHQRIVEGGVIVLQLCKAGHFRHLQDLFGFWPERLDSGTMALFSNQDRRISPAMRGCVLEPADFGCRPLTLAKTSQYLPRSNPSHYINAAVKMKPSAVFEHAPLLPAAKVIIANPLQPSLGDRPGGSSRPRTGRHGIRRSRPFPSPHLTCVLSSLFHAVHYGSRVRNREAAHGQCF